MHSPQRNPRRKWRTKTLSTLNLFILQIFLTSCQLPGAGLVLENRRIQVLFESSFDTVPPTEGALPTSVSDGPCQLVLLAQHTLLVKGRPCVSHLAMLIQFSWPVAIPSSACAQPSLGSEHKDHDTDTHWAALYTKWRSRLLCQSRYTSSDLLLAVGQLHKVI